MGTDIHLRVWTQRKDYWTTIRPVFDYEWYPERFWEFSQGLNLDLSVDFPTYQKWAEGREGEFNENYELWGMQKGLTQLTHLANLEEFRTANGHLTALKSRNYNYFAIVGNVRNGSGFAGVITGEEFTPISDNRGFDGLPFDPKEDDNEDAYGDHSFSWVTLRELLNYKWERTRTGTGVIPLDTDDDREHPFGRSDGPQTYAELRPNKKPSMWSGAISGANIRTISPREADAILSGDKTRQPTERLYVQHRWEETYRDAIGPRVYNAIQWLGQRLSPDRTYLVFGFDS